MSLRVLHAISSLEPRAGSVAITLPGLFRALRANDIESSVVTADAYWPCYRDAATTPADPSHVAPSHATPSDHADVLRDADVVHIHGWDAALAIDIAGRARAARKPYVVTPSGGLSTAPSRKKTWRDRLRGVFRERAALRWASTLTALNSAERDDLTRLGIATRVVVLPYGLDVAAYADPVSDTHDIPPPPDGPFWLLLGPMHPVEGHVPLLKAVAELGDACRDWRVVVAGTRTEDWRATLEAAVRRKGATGRVVFTDAPDPPTQRALLASAAVLVAPSLHIRNPVSVLQAAAAGVPVVATTLVAPDDLAAVLHVCEPTYTGIRNAMRTVVALTDEQRAHGAVEARELVRKTLDWSVLAEHYAALYRGVRGGSGGDHATCVGVGVGAAGSKNACKPKPPR